jgi:threonylcarbamoyladenosine tRNA methylthiotransferase MtaB
MMGDYGIKKIWIKSIGCKVNLADMASIVRYLPTDRFVMVTDPREAALAVLNTCTVTHKADSDVRKILGGLQRDYPHLPVIVTGCGATRTGNELTRFSNVRGIVAFGDRQALLEAIQEGTCSAPAQTQTSPYHRLGRQRAIVKLQDGCNTHCTYCVVPLVRGPERSLPYREACDQIRFLLDAGHHELVLSGIHLGRYGRDLFPVNSLINLLQWINRLPGLGTSFRIRLSSIEPMDLTPELVMQLAEMPGVCPHFHVPIQSGDDEVLARMGRPYRVREYQEIINRLSQHFPDAAIGTDVMVGFPGESEKAAQNTLRVVRSLPLTYLHVFTFSARKGTLAATFPERVNTEQIREHSKTLREEGARRWRAFLEDGINRSHQIVVERMRKKYFEGRSERYRPIRFSATEVKIGQLLWVRTETMDSGALVGVPCA